MVADADTSDTNGTLENVMSLGGSDASARIGFRQAGQTEGRIADQPLNSTPACG